MGTTQIMRACKRCARQTVHLQQTPNHILHLLLVVFTVGLWLPVWFLISMSKGKPQCTECGHSPGLFGVG